MLDYRSVIPLREATLSLAYIPHVGGVDYSNSFTSSLKKMYITIDLVGQIEPREKKNVLLSIILVA